jgi:hypothetical protein
MMGRRRLVSVLYRIPLLAPVLDEAKLARHYARQFKAGERDPNLKVDTFRSMRCGLTYYIIGPGGARSSGPKAG